MHLLDLPGHGLNRDSGCALEPGPVATAVFEQVPRAHWLGWSLGGLFALQAALDHPHRVSSLTMLASSPCFVRRMHWPLGMDADLFDSFASELEDDYEATLNRFLALEVHGSEEARRGLKRLRETAFSTGRPTLTALREGLLRLHSTDLVKPLATLQPPSLWLSGQHDRLVPWRAMQAAAGLTANSRHTVLEGAGHAPFINHRQAFVATLDEFLAGVEETNKRAECSR